MIILIIANLEHYHHINDMRFILSIFFLLNSSEYLL